jgi:hypothetical protein
MWRQVGAVLVSVNIIIKSGVDRPFAADIEQLPADIEVPRREASPAILFIFLIMAFFAFQILSSLAGPGFAAPVVFAAVALVAGLGWLWWRNRGQPHRIRFEQDGVQVIEQGLLRSRTWQAPYSDFKGVQLRRRGAKSTKGKQWYQIIELKHPDDHKTLPLYVEKSTDPPHDRWRAYAALFGVQAIDGGEQ